MADVEFSVVAYEHLVHDTAIEAEMIVAGRIADEAKPLTFVLKTRPPGRKEWSYSMPPGRLRRSIGYEMGEDAEGPYAYIGVDATGIPLAYFRNIGGLGVGAYGGSRGNNPSLLEALLAQVDRPIVGP